ncbi:putative metal-dependent HD superfamily phosphohydrolase [Chryseobacterium ginsenosidimutans]|uniref:HD domain-containing protein n=1 Tax=Chryseobacterium ginsenosidimutans TaxID=687846 RepID=UPI002784240E|nr:HD domain-containing protein [Chryseobacterium ginsenosidimutans]MDQ0595197.1 putative metal-dependent HD superfamily phosphohydrolase [Chryseobacterium ginsenosidimutans]
MDNLVEAVSSYVTLFLSESLSKDLSFHCMMHTYDVVSAALEIGTQCHLSEEEMLVLQVAAWFHDCGYVNLYIGHEEESKKIAQNFLENFGCEKDFIDAVLSCIDSTKYPPKPSSLLEKVLCDADMYHLTCPNYPKYEKAIRQEFEKYLGLSYTDEQWALKNCNFFKDHEYYTDYGRTVLAKFKEVNIKLMSYSKCVF